MRYIDLVIARLSGIKTLNRVELCKKTSSEAGLKHFLTSDLFGTTINIDDALFAAERDAKIMEMRGIGAVSIAEDEYPALLKEIYDPPAVIYYRGVLSKDGRRLAMVGTRKPSSQAMELCYRIARDLGAAGVSVVSGLALGIDAISHRGNVDGGGASIAVLGSAVDVVQPSSNKFLAKRVLERGGAIISEYPPGTPPTKWQFPERNRIISGLCPAILVGEAPKKSGALITANFALEQDRDLWVAANGIKAFGEGCKALAESGAHLITCAEDVLKEWGIELPLENSADSSFKESLAAKLARELGI